MPKAIHAQERLKAAREKAEAAIAEPRRRKMTRAAKPVKERIAETPTYYAFPDSHWIKIRTNNPLERVMKEIRRRTRAVGAFSDGKSCLDLAAARLGHIAGSQRATRKCMNIKPLHAEKRQTNGAIA